MVIDLEALVRLSGGSSLLAFVRHLGQLPFYTSLRSLYILEEIKYLHRKKHEIFVGLRVICMALRTVASQCSFISHVLKLMT